MDDKNEQLYCFMDHNRVCGPDCMAYKVIPDDNPQLDSAQQRCLILSSAERAGRSLNIIGSILHEISKRQKKREEDLDRRAAQSSSIPNPMGSIR